MANQAPIDALRQGIERATLSAFGENKRAVLFGTTDCAAAALQIERFVEQALSSQINEVLFLRMASACAAGLHLSDGRKIFLKIHAGEFSQGELQNLHRAQDQLRAKGLPAARLILPATDFSNGKFASVHAFRDRGERLRAYQKGAIAVAAQILARLVQAGRTIKYDSALPEMLTKRSHPFTKLSPGLPEPKPLPLAERIVSIEKAVTEDARNIQTTSQVIGHGDWASGNLRFSGGEVSSIFDFEALVRAPEPMLVGQAAIRFINEPSGVRDPAGAAAQFISAYEAAAGYAFEGEDAVSLDIGIALAVSTFLRSVVRSEGMRDEDAPRIFADFMQRFRATLGREYAKKAYF